MVIHGNEDVVPLDVAGALAAVASDAMACLVKASELLDVDVQQLTRGVHARTAEPAPQAPDRRGAIWRAGRMAWLAVRSNPEGTPRSPKQVMHSPGTRHF